MRFFLFAVTSLCLAACDSPSTSVTPAPVKQLEFIERSLNNTWFQDASKAVTKDAARAPGQQGRAKNIILFVGDGMGISTLTAARIFQGQQQGLSGEENSLSFEQFPFAGLIKTYNVDAQVPDSAGTMSAIVTGAKTRAGVLAVDASANRGDCHTQNGAALPSILEIAELAGKATGIVSTARITHATPAATYAKSVERDWENDAALSAEAQAAGCEDIAQQLVHFETRFAQRFAGHQSNGIEVVLGGGRANFLPAQAEFNSDRSHTGIEGLRQDGHNLTARWQQQHPQGHYVTDRDALLTLSKPDGAPLLGLFNPSHMSFEVDRVAGSLGEPSLSEMTDIAIRRLRQHENGFFLMVEAGRIDHAHHAGNAYRALSETVALSDAVAVATSLTNTDDTLILVTADHSHVFTMAGYPKRGNPILGKVVGVGESDAAQANDGKPYTTLGYANGPGHQSQDRQDLSEHDTTDKNYHQQSLVPLSSETHGGEDVAIFASGPGAALVSGSHEQNRIFHIMEFAGALFSAAGIGKTQ
ncbi:alkaline phosphatase [Spongiibacter taiwanensis]|uniref:alkaline phosphatase n=1 Tax=Spongiibacter taiwanensis TaxID=1748242 RepID=UPI002035D55D|nr:alkaline phosphatase [Spongiibacter taiwanensis]USA43971.1 alkaline phosphatase [Spongiibacter taiwanensis]